MCTGSGAIAISLAKEDNVKVIASDISSKALEVAKKNCIMNNVNVSLVESDLYKNIKEEFDIIISNPPYIKKDVIIFFYFLTKTNYLIPFQLKLLLNYH